MTSQLQGPVAGKAVYLEFVKPDMVTQVLVMPEGMSSAHKVVPFTVFRRRLSTSFPRRTWKMLSASVTSDRLIGPDANAKALNLMTGLTRYLESLQVNGWQLKIAPVVVEVTTDDLEQCRAGKTPYKALSRVWKARKHMGFPKEYIPEPGTVTLPTPTPSV